MYFSGHVDCVKLLLEYNADLNKIGGTGTEKTKPWQEAIECNQVGVVNVIFQHLHDINMLDVFFSQNNEIELKRSATSPEMIDVINIWSERKNDEIVLQGKDTTNIAGHQPMMTEKYQCDFCFNSFGIIDELKKHTENRSKSFTSLMADFPQDINRVSSFSR